MAKWGFGDDEDKISVEYDPRSTDFGKIRIGDTRGDIWGGFQQYSRFFDQAIMIEKKSTVSGKIIPYGGYAGTSRLQEGLRFLRGKTSPLVSFGIDALDGKYMFGIPFDLEDAVLQ